MWYWKRYLSGVFIFIFFNMSKFVHLFHLFKSYVYFYIPSHLYLLPIFLLGVLCFSYRFVEFVYLLQNNPFPAHRLQILGPVFPLTFDLVGRSVF